MTGCSGEGGHAFQACTCRYCCQGAGKAGDQGWASPQDGSRQAVPSCGEACREDDDSSCQARPEEGRVDEGCNSPQDSSRQAGPSCDEACCEADDRSWQAGSEEGLIVIVFINSG